MKAYVFLLFFLTTSFFSLSGQEVSTLLSDPSRQFAAMHWHPDGRIYSVDYFNGRLYQIFLDGTVETLVGSGFANLAGGGFDHEGNFYFCDINGGKVLRLNPADNSYTTVGAGFNMPVGVLASRTSNDTLLITEFEGNKVTKLSLSTGGKTTLVFREGINGPDAIQYAWNETDLLVSNWRDHQITRVAPNGSTTPFALVPATGFMGYVDRIGDYLYVPSFSAKKLYRINQDGEVTLIAGTGAIGFNDGPGATATFSRPNGTCHSPSGDTLLVSDHTTIRIITGMASVVASLRETPFLQEAILSPNPVRNQLTLSFPGTTTTEFIAWTVLDTSGKEIASGTLPEGSAALNLDTASYAGGHYILHMTEGKRTAVFKFTVTY